MEFLSVFLHDGGKCLIGQPSQQLSCSTSTSTASIENLFYHPLVYTLRVSTPSWKTFYRLGSFGNALLVRTANVISAPRRVLDPEEYGPGNWMIHNAHTSVQEHSPEVWPRGCNLNRGNGVQ